MNNYGQKISDLRKKHGLTQLELGNKLNVTAQAVSKWENGASEPDIETLRRISALFNVSIDELLSNETAATAVIQEESEKSQKSERVIVAKCERCGKDVAAGEYQIAVKNHTERSGRSTHSYTTQHVYCTDCFLKYQQEERAKFVEKTRTDANNKLNNINSSFRRGTIWGIIAAIVVAIGFIIAGTSANGLSPVLATVLGVISCYGIFAMVFQCFFDGYVLDILDFFERSFHLPGFIFSLDIDSIIWMIVTKFFLSILFGLLSAMIFALGVVIATFCSLFTFPFELRKNFRDRKAAVTEVGNAYKLK